mmetsp:Transcript_172911/g.554417  ORF Transcript_172911/g.554417 Transcript_172911/m.554417 type:complete len:219 (+) Transcript_172911:396-1052(+)
MFQDEVRVGQGKERHKRLQGVIPSAQADRQLHSMCLRRLRSRVRLQGPQEVQHVEVVRSRGQGASHCRKLSASTRLDPCLLLLLLIVEGFFDRQLTFALHWLASASRGLLTSNLCDVCNMLCRCCLDGWPCHLQISGSGRRFAGGRWKHGQGDDAASSRSVVLGEAPGDVLQGIQSRRVQGRQCVEIEGAGCGAEGRRMLLATSLQERNQSTPAIEEA